MCLDIIRLYIEEILLFIECVFYKVNCSFGLLFECVDFSGMDIILLIVCDDVVDVNFWWFFWKGVIMDCILNDFFDFFNLIFILFFLFW